MLPIIKGFALICLEGSSGLSVKDESNAGHDIRKLLSARLEECAHLHVGGGRDIPSPPSPHVRYHDKCMCFAVQADASTDVGLFGCVILPLVTPRRDIPAFPYMADKSSPMNLTCGQNEQQCAKCLSIMHICSEVGLEGGWRGAFHPEVNVAA